MLESTLDEVERALRSATGPKLIEPSTVLGLVAALRDLFVLSRKYGAERDDARARVRELEARVQDRECRMGWYVDRIRVLEEALRGFFFYEDGGRQFGCDQLCDRLQPCAICRIERLLAPAESASEPEVKDE